MEQDTEVFVGIDVAKTRNAIAVAEGERGGEVRFLGEVDASGENTRRVIQRIAAKHGRGRVHGRGTPVRRFVADVVEARGKTGKAPDAYSGMR